MDGESAPTRKQIEDEFRQLLEDNDLPDADEVRHDPATGDVTFLWHNPRVAVVVESRASN
jgi:hypothetical protein